METLSAEQIAGATPLPDAPAAPPSPAHAATAAPAQPSTVQLSADEIAGAQPIDDAAPEKPGILDRIGSGLSTVAGGAVDAVKSMGRGAGVVLAEASPLDSEGLRVPFSGLAVPAKRREFERGLSDVVTAGAAEAFGKKVDQALASKPGSMAARGTRLLDAVTGGGGPSLASTEQADAAAAPGYRDAGGLAGAVLPNPIGEVVKPVTRTAGKLGGAVVRKVVGGAEDRAVVRAVEDIEEGATKKTRAGLEKSEDKVAEVARENPEIVAHSRDNKALIGDAQKIRKRASGGLDELYSERDVAAGRRAVAPDVIAKAEEQEERAAAARAEAEANPAGSGARAAAEREAKEAQAAADQLRREAAKKISATPAHGVDMTEPLSNLDRSISRMKGGDPTERLAAKELERIRDELAEAKGKDGVIPARELRTEQSARQTIGYAKATPGMPDYEVTNAKILANRQASRDIGDSIVRHVTGMDYEAAKAAASADPTSVAGRLFKLNGEIEGAARIEAAAQSKLGASKHSLGEFLHFIHRAKHAGALGAAATAAEAAGLHGVAKGLGVAAGATALAPVAARHADNALLSLARAGLVGTGKATESAIARGGAALAADTAGRAAVPITPAMVNQVIQFAHQPGATYEDVVTHASEQGLPPEIGARVAIEAGKQPSAQGAM